MTPTPKLTAWLEQIESGNIETMEARILNFLKKETRSTVYEISKATGIKMSTITARLDTLASAGAIYKLGQRKPEGAKRNYTLYGYVVNPDNREYFGKMYNYYKARKRLNSIIEDNKGLYSRAFKTAAQRELAWLEHETEETRIEQPIVKA